MMWGRKTITFLGVACCLSFQAYSQVVVTGKVTEAQWGAALYPATVLDSTTGRIVYSDPSGHYAITARAGDVLVYRYLGFYTETYRVPGGLTPLTHNVVLVSRRVSLKTVDIRAFTPYQQDSLERIKTFGHYLRLPIAHFFGGSAGGLGVAFHPISPFSKDNRRKKRFHKMYKQFEKDAFVDSRYTPKLVHRLTGMRGDSLRFFLFEVRPDYAFTRHAPDLLFWSWIIRKCNTWRKTNPVLSPATETKSLNGRK